MSSQNTLKNDVKDFWEKASCGEALYLDDKEKENYLSQLKVRYTLEPEILRFARFPEFNNKKTLEIGVGLGADHQMLAESGAILSGIDLTQRAVDHSTRRFQLLNLQSHIQVGDAENLPFENETFDAVYSWGVLHHTPNTPKAFEEVCRILKPGGIARVMIYYKYSLISWMLWFRYAALRLKPGLSINQVLSNYLESPGTKAYSYKEIPELAKGFSVIKIETPLTHGDLLSKGVGQKHQGALLSFAKKIWPRWFFRIFFPNNGLFMMIELVKK